MSFNQTKRFLLFYVHNTLKNNNNNHFYFLTIFKNKNRNPSFAGSRLNILNWNIRNDYNLNSTQTRSFTSDTTNNNDDKKAANPQEINPFQEEIKQWNEFATYYDKTLKSQMEKQESNAIDVNSIGSEFTHFDNQTNRPKQVDISEKQASNVRVACASGYIQLNEYTYNALVQNKLKKGNALTVSQLAGIQASKHTAHLIPLCHQILLDVCDVNFRTDDANKRIVCEAICKTSVSKTGVEMEALTACSISLLTIYDMVKALQKDAIINEIKLDYKYGGKSDYNRSKI